MNRPITAREYQERAKEYAVYPKGHLDRNYQSGRIPEPYPLTAGQVYCLLGLASELGEYLVSRIGKDDPPVDISELGDIAWYIAQLATECGIHLEDTYSRTYSNEGVILMNVMGSVKKFIRDGSAPNWAELVSMCWGWLYSEAWAFDRGLNTEVLPANLAKLADRKARGVIQGSGDNR